MTQILNFGLPAPIDIQIDGTDIDGNRQVADKMLDQLRQVPGLVDARIQQAFDYPGFNIAVDRTKAAQGGFTERDVANSLLNILSGSIQVTPMFFLNRQNGVNYNLVAQTPQYDIQSLQDLAEHSRSPRQRRQHPRDSRRRRDDQRARARCRSITHYNIRRVVDIYASVQDRDLGAVGRDVTRIVDANRKLLPRGSFVTVRGQVETMRSSYLESARRPRLLHRAGLSADRRQLPVLARSRSSSSPRCPRRWPASCCSCSSPTPPSACRR